MKTLLKTIKSLDSEKGIEEFLASLFTPEEVAEFERRLKVISLLKKGYSQREISKKLKVGVATVSRGARELKLGRFKFFKN